MITDKDIEAGAYRQRITVYRVLARATDAMGDKITWDNEAGDKIWAKVRPVSVRRALEYQQFVPNAVYEVEIRYNRSLNIQENNTLILFNSMYFIVGSVINEDLQNRKLTFLVSAHKGR